MMTYMNSSPPLSKACYSDSDVRLINKPLGERWDSAVEEESIFGIVSRFHKLSGNICSRNTIFDLTGNYAVHFSLFFPSFLPELFVRLRLPLSSVGELVNRHTILPYFRLFAKSNHYAKIYQELVDGSGRRTQISLGMLSGRLGTNVLRFCPDCASEDIQTLGIATWYRVHQLPGVLVCPYHGSRLKFRSTSIKGRAPPQFILPNLTEAGEDCVGRTDNYANKKLLKFATLSAELLALENTGESLDDLRQKYLSHLCREGLAKVSMCHRQEEFVDRFCNFWCDLKSVEPFSLALSSCHRQDSWLIGLCQKPHSTVHPLKQLLLIGFLADSVRSFLDWPTLSSVNAASERVAMQYETLEESIGRLHREGQMPPQIAKLVGIPASSVRIIGAKIGIDFEKRPTKARHVVRCQARSALAAGESLTNIGRMTHLSVSTITTILAADPQLEQQRSLCLLEKRRILSRQKFQNAIKEFKPATLSYLDNIMSEDLAWLYRHDREWLREQARLAGMPASRGVPIDWGERDEILVIEIWSAITTILSLADPYVRVTRKEITCRVKHAVWMSHNFFRLPKTKILLDRETETYEGFKERSRGA